MPDPKLLEVNAELLLTGSGSEPTNSCLSSKTIHRKYLQTKKELVSKIPHEMPGTGDPLPAGHQRGHPSESPSASMSSSLLKPAGISFSVPWGNHTPQTKPDYYFFLIYSFIIFSTGT